MLLVIAAAVLDDLPTAQIGILMFAALGIFHCYMQAVSGTGGLSICCAPA
jgi:hypothetical protein